MLGAKLLKTLAAPSVLGKSAYGTVGKNVGILAMETYFPRRYVDQSELEVYDKASTGKYVNGLGQLSMSFTDDREDMNSIAMTAVANLMEKFNISPRDIGRLEVGTETIVDKSKSVKSSLMPLFAESGNTSIEGIDTTNACYGGTSALFNALQWMESSYWDGRYAIVVAGDIAVYEPGPARPTGGAGCVAMLVGPNAPLVFEQGLRGTHMEHAWDFYKPQLTSEYPTVDGKHSNDCYIRALDRCYTLYGESFARRYGRAMTLDDLDYTIFHSPYSKLVQKSWARMYYLDFLQRKSNPVYAQSKLHAFEDLKPEETYNHKEIMNASVAETAESYKNRVEPALYISKRIGNSYCGSVYTGLQSLVEGATQAISGKRVALFSYGSGLAASLFSLRVEGDVSAMAKTAGTLPRFDERWRVTPQEFSDALLLREKTHNLAPYKPVGDIAHLFPNTFYLDEVDDQYKRFYKRS